MNKFSENLKAAGLTREDLAELAEAEDIVYICKHTAFSDALAQLAEEAAEATQAALKLRRAIVPTASPTPVKTEDALVRLYEELADVRACVKVLELYDNKFEMPPAMRINIIAGEKIWRWAKRLRDARGGEQGNE